MLNQLQPTTNLMQLKIFSSLIKYHCRDTDPQRHQQLLCLSRRIPVALQVMQLQQPFLPTRVSNEKRGDTANACNLSETVTGSKLTLKWPTPPRSVGKRPPFL